jgi:hypothetical protein
VKAAVSHRILLWLNVPVVVVSFYLVFYSLAGLWVPEREWLRPIFIVSPVLLGVWFAVSGRLIAKGWTFVALAMDILPVALLALCVVSVLATPS